MIGAVWKDLKRSALGLAFSWMLTLGAAACVTVAFFFVVDAVRDQLAIYCGPIAANFIVAAAFIVIGLLVYLVANRMSATSQLKERSLSLASNLAVMTKNTVYPSPPSLPPAIRRGAPLTLLLSGLTFSLYSMLSRRALQQPEVEVLPPVKRSPLRKELSVGDATHALYASLQRSGREKAKEAREGVEDFTPIAREFAARRGKQFSNLIYDVFPSVGSFLFGQRYSRFSIGGLQHSVLSSGLRPRTVVGFITVIAAVAWLSNRERT